MKPIHGLILSVTVTCAILFGVIPLTLYFSAHNREVGLRNQFNAQQEANTAVFDNTWKIIQQETQVAAAERASFRETFVDIMGAQQGVAGNGSLASFFTQAKVDVTPVLYKKLMTSIEAQRTAFLDSQRKLLQIKKDHDDVITQYPSAFFVGGRDALEPQLVTSTKTKSTFEGGVEDDVYLDPLRI